MAFEVDCFDGEEISFIGTPTIVDDVDPPKNLFKILKVFNSNLSPMLALSLFADLRSIDPSPQMVSSFFVHQQSNWSIPIFEMVHRDPKL